MSRPTRSATELVALDERLASAIATRDRAAFRSLFTTPVRFWAVTPRRFWDAETPVEVEDIVFGHWFPEGVAVSDVRMLERQPVAHSAALGYRMWVQTPVGPTVVEQVGYYQETEGRISDLRMVCSGFHRV
jgi:hypothetical protein